MRIAVNTRFLLNHKMEGFGWYTYEIVKRLVENHPEHEFIFFFDRPFDERFVFGKNVTPVVLKPQARHPFLFYLWFEFSVAKALKKYKADLFFSPDGYLSLRSSVKQIGVIHDINFEHNPKDLKWLNRKYFCRFFPKYAQKADHILTVSEYSKADICATYKIPENKVTAIWNGASSIFKPLDDTTIKKTQEKYADGKDYFLFVGAIHPRKNVQRLIEAFAQLKTENPNNTFQLVIVGVELWNNANVKVDLAEEIKSQIHFTGHLPIEDLAVIMGSASVFTYVPYFEGFGIPLVEAMKCGTPILSGNKTSLPEVAGDAALYCDPFNVKDIASKMLQLCEDEKLRTELKNKGIERGALFSWDSSAEKVWQKIEETV